MAQTVVLNNAWQPLGGIPQEDAICLIVTGKAWASKNHPTKVYRSKNISIPAPEVIILNHHVKMHGFKIKPEKLTNPALFRRDNYTCQYCNRHKNDLRSWERLEREHIIPVSRGGANDWENVVTACSACNHKKDDRTPQEAGMRLLRTPKIPVTWTIRGKSKLTSEQILYIEDVLNIK